MRGPATRGSGPADAKFSSSGPCSTSGPKFEQALIWCRAHWGPGQFSPVKQVQPCQTSEAEPRSPVGPFDLARTPPGLGAQPQKCPKKDKNVGSTEAGIERRSRISLDL